MALALVEEAVGVFSNLPESCAWYRFLEKRSESDGFALDLLSSALHHRSLSARKLQTVQIVQKVPLSSFSSGKRMFPCSLLL